MLRLVKVGFGGVRLGMTWQEWLALVGCVEFRHGRSGVVSLGVVRWGTACCVMDGSGRSGVFR